MDRTWDIFVSYSHRDADRVRTIVNDLKKQNFRVWFDYDAIEAGDRLRESINTGIRHSSVILMMISLHSLRSNWVLNELDVAMVREIREHKKIVIPILLGRIGIEQLPEDLRGKIFFDLRYNFIKKYETLKSEIIRVLKALISKNINKKFNIPIGLPALSVILNYEYKGDNQTKKLPRETVNKLIEVFKKNYEDPTKEEFIEKYGQVMWHKLWEYYLDRSDIDLAAFIEDVADDSPDSQDKSLNDLFMQIALFIDLLAIVEGHPDFPDDLLIVMDDIEAEDIMRLRKQFL